MASEWRQSTWGNEISLEYGKGIRGYKDGRGPYQVYGSNGPVGWTSSSLAPGPGVILGRKGANRGVEYSKEPFFVIDTAYYVKPKNELNMRWVYYAIKHHRLGEIDDGSPIPSTTRSAVYVHELRVPPLSVQQRIADVLGKLDDKIELNRRMNRTLEKMAAAIFESWFIDFDPVHAKAKDRDPNLPPEISAHFPYSFKDSELGEIPEGWGIGRLDDLLVLQRGFDLPVKNRQSGSVPVIMASGPGDHHVEHKVSGPGVVTGRSGKLGNVFLIPNNFWPLNTTLWVKEFRRSRPCHAFLLLKELALETYNAGSAVPTLNRNHVHNLPVLLPPANLIDAYENIALSLYRKCWANEDQDRRLASLRDSLLTKLLSGAIELPETQAVAEEVSS